MIEIKAPVLPESISEATIVLWHKKTGDTVRVDEVIVEIETDKVVLEVPSEVNGIMGKIIKDEGTLIEGQQVLAYVEEKDEAELAKEEVVPKHEIKKEAPTGPAARKLMQENSLSRSEVTGSGKDGRILKEDVISQKQTPANTPTARFEERVPMSSLRKTVAGRLLAVTKQTAMLTTFNELDMSAVIDIRKKHKEAFEKTYGVRLGFMSFFVKAAVEALKKFPAVNAYIDNNDIVYHGFCDVGVAVSSKRGLVVPILKNAHKMSLNEIESDIANLANKAQDGKLTLEEITGGTFTISNGGTFGSMLSTPILNSPQSAILGMHNIENRAVVVDGEVVVRPIMYLALSYDHRIIDGREAVLFLRSIKDSLADPSRLLLSL